MNIFLPIASLLRENLFAHEIMHGIVALPFAILLWKKTKKKRLVVILFIVTYLMDLDHLIDYISFYGFDFSLSNFFGGNYFEITGKAYIPFHAWEWLIIFGVLGKLRGWKSKYTAVALGMLPHLVFDTIIWKHFLLYSITYRIINSFKVF